MDKAIKLIGFKSSEDFMRIGKIISFWEDTKIRYPRGGGNLGWGKGAACSYGSEETGWADYHIWETKTMIVIRKEERQ